MKKSIYLILIILLFSCDKEVKEIYQEYNGQRVKVEFSDSDADSLFTGFRGSAYENGNLKSLAYYNTGVIIDTLFLYHENGKIKEKGLMKNNLKIGWWLSFNEQGNLITKTEVLNFRDTLYKNQVKYYEKNGNLKLEPSTFFELDIPDTLRIGKNLARVKNYVTNFNNGESNLLTVIIDNQYSEIEFKKDTFSDGTLKPFFGIYGYQVGKQKIKGKLEEKIMTRQDSSTLTINHHYKYFEKEVYVWNKDKYSNSGLRIKNQMKEEYKNN